MAFGMEFIYGWRRLVEGGWDQNLLGFFGRHLAAPNEGLKGRAFVRKPSRVIGGLGAAMSGDGRAGGESSEGQGKEDEGFGWLKGANGAVSGDQLSRFLKISGWVLKRIGQSDCEVLNQGSGLGVAEVQESDDLVVLHEDVLIIDIAVEHPLRTSAQQRLGDGGE